MAKATNIDRASQPASRLGAYFSEDSAFPAEQGKTNNQLAPSVSKEKYGD